MGDVVVNETSPWRGFAIIEARPFGYVITAPGMRPRWRPTARTAIALGRRLKHGHR